MFSFVVVVTAEDCDLNEIYVECASDISCQPTCIKPDGTPCPRDCSSRLCECKEGFIRNANLTCINKTECIRRKSVDSIETCLILYLSNTENRTNMWY
jgi:hypothetical protein